MACPNGEGPTTFGNFIRVQPDQRPNRWLAGSPADFGKLIAEETEKWAKVVKISGAKPD
jgi:hypothetical protein